MEIIVIYKISDNVYRVEKSKRNRDNSPIDNTTHIIAIEESFEAAFKHVPDGWLKQEPNILPENATHVIEGVYLNYPYKR